MDIFSVIAMLGGLAMFLYGMNTMGSGLEKLAGGRLERVLGKMTDNPIKGVALGAFVTAVIQSSSAVTVMVVGFVNSGIMQLSQAVGIIMGANIGTTFTSWILSLTGLEAVDSWVSLLKPATFAPLAAFFGIILIFLDKNGRKKDVGSIFLGFAVLMYGMSTMSDAVEPLSQVPEFANILLMFSNPVLGVLAGAVFTAVIQSSSASVGILQALSTTGAITVGSAIPILLGQNIGTCVTALISSVGASRNAKRAAAVHLYFNIIGTALFLILFYLVNFIVDLPFINNPLNSVGIAVIHTIFNVLATAVLLPFSKQLEKLALITVKDEEVEDDFPMLDERFLTSPSFAVEQSFLTSVKMSEISRQCFLDALDLIKNYDAKKAENVRACEALLDEYEDRLGSYLLKISSRDLSEKDSNSVAVILHTIGDFERIGDHALNILELTEEMYRKKASFSGNAMTELDTMVKALRDIVIVATDSYRENDAEMARHVEPVEQVVDLLKDKLKANHLDRIRRGECSIEQGFVFNDIVTNMERVSDHCSNIAVCLIRLSLSDFDTHRYLNTVKYTTEGQFAEDFNKSKKKYNLD